MSVRCCLSFGLLLLLIGVSVTLSSQVTEAAAVDSDFSLFDVTHYGAKGDGVTDDANSVRQATAALVSAGAGTLYFPQGRYVLGQTGSGNVPFIRLSIMNGNFTLAGDGVNSTFLMWNQSCCDMLTSFEEESNSNFFFRNFSIEPLPPTDPPPRRTYYALDMAYGQAIYLQSIRVDSPPNSRLTVLGSYQTSALVWIDDVELNGPFGVTNALQVTGLATNPRLQVRVNNLRGTSDGHGTAFYAQGTVDGVFTNVQLDTWAMGVIGDDIFGTEIDLATVYAITDSVFQDVGQAGISLYCNGTVLASNCTFISTQPTSTEFDGTGVLAGRSDPDDLHVFLNLTVINSQFINLNQAGFWEDGHLCIRDSIMTNTIMAIRVDVPEPLPDNTNTFTLENCKITADQASTQPVVYLAGPMSNFIIQNNQCSGISTGIEAPCGSNCVIQNNPGCGSILVEQF